jgi:hypothetical protein
MDQEDRLPAIVEYLRMNPTPSLPGTETAGGPQIIHVHEHHHYAPAPAPPPVPERTGPGFAEKLLPWIWLGLGATVILTICAVVLAAVIMALVVGTVAVAVAAAAVAYLVKTTRESQINSELLRQLGTQRRRR